MNQTRRSGHRKSGLVTALALLAGALAVYKRIPLTNRIGDNGNAYFGMAYDTFLFFFLLCGHASQTVVAQMTAARCAKGQYRNTRRVWNAAVLCTLILGIAGSAAMALSAGILAGGLFRTQEAAFVIRCMAPSVLIASLAGALRGYFQGMGSMVPTAFSRFAEELAGFLLMFSLVSGLGGYGKKVGALLFQPDYEQAFGAGGAALLVLIVKAVGVRPGRAIRFSKVYDLVRTERICFAAGVQLIGVLLSWRILAAIRQPGAGGGGARPTAVSASLLKLLVVAFGLLLKKVRYHIPLPVTEW